MQRQVPARARADHPLPDILEDLLGQRVVAQLPQQEAEQALAMACIQARTRAGRHRPRPASRLHRLCAGFHGVQGKACRRWRIAGDGAGRARFMAWKRLRAGRKTTGARFGVYGLPLPRCAMLGGSGRRRTPRDCHLSTHVEPAEETTRGRAEHGAGARIACAAAGLGRGPRWLG